MEPSSHERRTCRRAKFSGITFLWAGERELPCVAGDVSESGILVYPQRRAAVDTGHPLRLSFTLPSMRSWIQLDGTLVRRSERARREAWGVQFLGVPAEVRRLLRSFIERTEPRAVTPSRTSTSSGVTRRVARPALRPSVRRTPGTLATWRSDGSAADPERTIIWKRRKR